MVELMGFCLMLFIFLGMAGLAKVLEVGLCGKEEDATT